MEEVAVEVVGEVEEDVVVGEEEEKKGNLMNERR